MYYLRIDFVFYDESELFYDQRHNIIKRFEIQTIIINRRGYMSMLLKRFCRDLTNVIIEYLM